MKLRPYQAAACQRVREHLAKREPVVLISPTGSGKTVMATLGCIAPWVARGGRAIFAVHLREVVDGASAALTRLGIEHGVVMSGRKKHPDRRVQVCSIQTLESRGATPEASLVVIDECHRASSPTYERLVAAYPQAALLGLTATPIRSDGKGLRPPDGPFRHAVTAIQPDELVQMGNLVPVEVFGPNEEQIEAIKVSKRTGDFSARGSSRAMSRPNLVGEVVQHWHRLAKERRTIAFAVSKNHAQALLAEFRRTGVPCAYVDGTTGKRARARAQAQLKRGEIKVLINVGVFTEGWDEPLVEVVQVAVPTMSLGRWLQMAGRGLRPVTAREQSWCKANGVVCPRKTHATIIDHGGNVARFGFPTHARHWDLSARDLSPERLQAEARENVRRHPTCPSCAFVLAMPAPQCPRCGSQISRPWTTLDAQLERLRPADYLYLTK